MIQSGKKNKCALQRDICVNSDNVNKYGVFVKLGCTFQRKISI